MIRFEYPKFIKILLCLTVDEIAFRPYIQTGLCIKTNRSLMSDLTKQDYYITATHSLKWF